MPPIIRVENLSKQYFIGELQKRPASLRQALSGMLSAPLKRLRRNGHAQSEILWALKDINFEVQPGEVVGLIGHNGAGKSTLLKILSRITDPTAGQIELYGRVVSLLEVGTGFHPELTGRENVFLNGAVLGMSKADIRRKFDEIVAFAEVEKFIDTPVKFYSSGMYVRLAFAVAAHLEPEILIIDEVLSVGDMAFQQKCLQKIGKMREQTKAIILVSHNMLSVKAICTKAILLSHGEVVSNGATQSVIPLYEKMLMKGDDAEEVADQHLEGIGHIKVKSVLLINEAGQEQTSFETGDPVKVLIEYDARTKVDGAVIFVGIRRPDCFKNMFWVPAASEEGVLNDIFPGGIICSATSTELEEIKVPQLEGHGTIELDIPRLLVIPGEYMLDVTFYDQNFEFRQYFLGRKLVNFQVSSVSRKLDEKYGVFYQPQNWRINGG
jgi:lipopolysaccharide transport system ATP-binding protein